ncbi:MAG: hypothetical protein K0R28_5764, partial [Paenibacillus sp.]|nr:hypothetical protein [Paenibacillus sp.]
MPKEKKPDPNRDGEISSSYNVSKEDRRAAFRAMLA